MKKKPSAAAAKVGKDEGDEGDDDDDDDEEMDEGEEEEEAAVGDAMNAMKVIRKPSAPTVMKRPASTHGVRYVIPVVNKKVLKNTTWKIWGSKVFHESKRAATHKGLPKGDCLEVGRAYYGQASSTWVAAGGSKAAENADAKKGAAKKKATKSKSGK